MTNPNPGPLPYPGKPEGRHPDPGNAYGLWMKGRSDNRWGPIPVPVPLAVAYVAVVLVAWAVALIAVTR